ncbi:MAG: SDR family oxidoreductase [Candidatus Aminicenantes bacterium]|nr:SDR family oxidoreductase [Candidatus Aminicenantes bacterium]
MSDRVALVTGSSRGIGRAIALRLAEDPEVGAVAVHYRSEREAALDVVRLIRRGGKRSTAIWADLNQEKNCRRILATAEQRLGRVDILVNNFGPFLMKPWLEVSSAESQRIFRGCFLSALHCLQAALPAMRSSGWGRVVNIGYHRVEQWAAFPGILPYAAAKAALLLLTRTAAAGEAGSGVTVNMVSPGLIRGGRMPRGTRIPARFLGEASDVAEAAAWLASDRAAGVNGANVIVAGPWKM